MLIVEGCRPCPVKNFSGLPTKSQNPVCLLYTILLQYTQIINLHSYWLYSVYIENQFHILQILMPVKYPWGGWYKFSSYWSHHTHTPNLCCLCDMSLHVWYMRFLLY